MLSPNDQSGCCGGFVGAIGFLEPTQYWYYSCLLRFSAHSGCVFFSRDTCCNQSLHLLFGNTGDGQTPDWRLAAPSGPLLLTNAVQCFLQLQKKFKSFFVGSLQK